MKTLSIPKKIKKMIEGPLDINRLDIFEQRTMQSLSHDLLQCIVTPAWMNTSLVMNLCKEYFQTFYKSSEHKSLSELADIIAKAEDSVKTYFSYVLLDFAKVDSSMEAAPLGFTIEIAEILGIVNIFEKTLRKELKLTIRNFKALKQSAMSELQEVKESKNESLYDE